MCKLVIQQYQWPIFHNTSLNRFRSQMHQALEESEWRAEMEAKVKEIVDQAGNLDDIDVEQLIKAVKGRNLIFQLKNFC